MARIPLVARVFNVSSFVRNFLTLGNRPGQHVRMRVEWNRMAPYWFCYDGPACELCWKCGHLLAGIID